MASQEREDTTPFLLRLFYKTGSFHRTDEFSSRPLPPSLSLYTWPSCTLIELAHLIAAEDPNLLPSPSVGTRLAFRLVYPDARNTAATAAAGHHHHQQRFMVKDLGSVVLGESSATGTGTFSATNGAEGDGDVDMSGVSALPPLPDQETMVAKNKTLGDARFVVGDYVACCILPPLPDGSVARSERLTAASRGSAAGALVHSRRQDAGFGGRQGRDRDRRRGTAFGDAGFPEGEWRRGERLPDDPPDRSYGRGRRLDRW